MNQSFLRHTKHWRAGFGSAGRKKGTKKGQEEENFFQDKKSEEEEKQKKLFISRAIQYNEVCETKQDIGLLRADSWKSAGSKSIEEDIL